MDTRTKWVLAVGVTLAVLITPGASGTPSQLLGQFLINVIVYVALTGAIVQGGAWVWNKVSGKPQRTADPPASVGAAPTKKCPECAETVLAEAKLCRFCRHPFPAT